MHPEGIFCWIEIGQGRCIVVELISQDQNKLTKGGGHALRQVMSRPHTAQGLLGRCCLLPLNAGFMPGVKFENVRDCTVWICVKDYSSCMDHLWWLCATGATHPPSFAVMLWHCTRTHYSQAFTVEDGFES